MNTLTEELAQTDLLWDVPQAILDTLMQHDVPRELVPGEVLLSPEQENHHVYLLLSGALTVQAGPPDSPVVQELAQGSSVGEESLLDEASPSAWVFAKEASRVFPIHRDLILQIVAKLHPFTRNLLQMLTRWHQSNIQSDSQNYLHIGEFADQGNIDSLTGLYNRRWLDSAFSRLLAQSRRGEQSLCVLMIDVDHFKRYNEKNGTLGGDRALVAVGEVLRTSVRPYDFSTRYGDGKFLVLLLHTKQEEGLAVAERIRKAAEKKTVAYPEGQSVPGITVSIPLPGITVSIGLAVSQSDSAMQLISAADAHLYRAKRDGHNCVRY